jgi:hypothetical protein
MTLRKHFLLWLAIGDLGLAGLCCAQQSKSKLAETKDVVQPNEMVGTKIVKEPSKITDSIVALQTGQPTTAIVATVEGQSSAKPLTEIASLQQEIKNKQKRLELLMHMFVADERPFLIDPGSIPVDQDTVTKRRFEQEELHKASAAIAALQAKLDQLTKRQERTAAN